MSVPRKHIMRFFTKFFFVSLVLVSFFAFHEVFAQKTRLELDTEIKGINNEIDAQKTKIEQIEKRIKNYQRNIIEFQKQAKNLANELSVLDLTIDEKKSEIEKIQAEIDKKNLEIQNITLQILEKELLVQEKKENLSDFLKRLERLSRRDSLDTLVLYDTFSDYYREIKLVEDIQWGIRRNLDQIKSAKDLLIANKDTLESSNDELLALAVSQEEEYALLADQQNYKVSLISQTKQSEDKYQDLLEQSKKEHLAAEAEITKLDSVVREKISQLDSIGRSNQGFAWPTSSSRCCSAYFYDPTYPFRHLFEHDAIDIPSPQGTTIVAARDGYVARVRSPKEVGTGYAYMMIIHEDGFSTVYGHISCALVSVDTLVKQGDPIACVGGSPGTLGAGNLSTGSHLHFGVRKDGVPVDPLKYLP